MSAYLNPQFSKPVISCLGGAVRKQGHLTINTNTYIQISSEKSDVCIHFTINGRTPSHNLDADNDTYLYQGAFKLSASESRTVKAICVKSGSYSATTTELFHVTLKDTYQYDIHNIELSHDVLHDKLTQRSLYTSDDNDTEITHSDLYFGENGAIYKINSPRREMDSLDFSFTPKDSFRSSRGVRSRYHSQSSRESSPSRIIHRTRCPESPKSKQLSDRSVNFYVRSDSEDEALEYGERNYFRNDRNMDSKELDDSDDFVSGFKTHRYDRNECSSSFRPNFEDDLYDLDISRKLKEDSFINEDIYFNNSRQKIEPTLKRKSRESNKQSMKSIVDIDDQIPTQLKSDRSKEMRRKRNNSESRSKKKLSSDSSSSDSDSDNKSSSSSSDKNKKSIKELKTKKKSSNLIYNTEDELRVKNAIKKANKSLRKSKENINDIKSNKVNAMISEAKTVNIIYNYNSTTKKSESNEDDEDEEAEELESNSTLNDKDMLSEKEAPVERTEQVEQHSLISWLGDLIFGEDDNRSKEKKKKPIQSPDEDESKKRDFRDKHPKRESHKVLPNDSKHKKMNISNSVKDKPSESIAHHSEYERICLKCKANKTLWEDKKFKADDSSLFNSSKRDRKILWKRPNEICKDPKLFVGGADRFDVVQGELGDCWLLAAMASLCSVKSLLNNVIPVKQSFTNNYYGIFAFNIWQYGKWIEVLIDDRLPVMQTNEGYRLIYIKSQSKNEFWSALLEKAFAKIYGDYESLGGGLTSEAMTDFTGGVVTKFNFREELPYDMYSIARKAFASGSLLGCSIDSAKGGEEMLANGLIRGHAYTITDIRMIHKGRRYIKMIRIRNPWGNSREWKGAWGDKSIEWQSLNSNEMRDMGLQFKHDGEFWMSFKDFTTHYHRMEICNILNNNDKERSSQWRSTISNGAWKKPINTGGCRNFPVSFCSNPQYRIDIPDFSSSEETFDSEDVGQTTIAVGLMQKGQRTANTQNHTIGYEIYEITDNIRSPLDRTYFACNRPIARSIYINSREVTGHHCLQKGKSYMIIPTTYDKGKEAHFIVRIYSEVKLKFSQLNNKTGFRNKNSGEKAEKGINKDYQIKGLHKEDVSKSLNYSKPSNKCDNNIDIKSCDKDKIEELFNTFCGDDFLIDVIDLKNLLEKTFSKDLGEIDIGICRSLLSMEDNDRTGKLSLDEFIKCWKYLTNWKIIFKNNQNEDKLLSEEGIKTALSDAGYSLSLECLNSCIMRYSSTKKYEMTFSDLLSCNAKLKSLIDISEVYSNEKEQVIFSKEDFIECCLYT